MGQEGGQCVPCFSLPALGISLQNQVRMSWPASRVRLVSNRLGLSQAAPRVQESHSAALVSITGSVKLV